MARIVTGFVDRARAAAQARRPDPNARYTQLLEEGDAAEARRLDDNLALVRAEDPFADKLFTVTFAQAAAEPDYIGPHMQRLLSKYAIEKGRTGELHLYAAIDEGPSALI